MLVCFSCCRCHLTATNAKKPRKTYQNLAASVNHTAYYPSTHILLLIRQSLPFRAEVELSTFASTMCGACVRVMHFSAFHLGYG